MSWQHHRARVASLTRSRPLDDPELINARRDLRAERLAEHVRGIVESAPAFDARAKRPNRAAARANIRQYSVRPERGRSPGTNLGAYVSAGSFDEVHVTGAVVLDLRGLDRHEAKMQSYDLGRVPDGCRVVLHVGGIHPGELFEAQRWLREAAGRLRIDVLGTVSAVPLWLAALRGQDWREVAS